jgi:xylulose-5-phosphate/fructose-6-phosphate phosphoketolase
MPTCHNTLSPKPCACVDAHWSALNYLPVEQIYRPDSPLFKRPLALADITRMLLGHRRMVPRQNFICVNPNRVINKHNLGMIGTYGAGRGGQAVVARAYLKRIHSEACPGISRDRAGLQKLFRQFLFSGGIASRASPEDPGSVHQGGELGYSLVPSFGAVFENPNLVVACVIGDGDGEAETGLPPTAWRCNRFPDPVTDGTVLPVPPLNSHKMANPTVLARITREEPAQLLRGRGRTPLLVKGHQPAWLREALATVRDTAVEQIRAAQKEARATGQVVRPHWSMLVLDLLRGWTGSKEAESFPMEGALRAHQVPLKMLRDMHPPDFRDCACEVLEPAAPGIGDPPVLTSLPRDVATLGDEQRNVCVFGANLALSDSLNALFEMADPQEDAANNPNDRCLAPTGRVMEMPGEPQREAWLEGYLPTGRHAIFNSHEAFICIIDPMFNQHPKGLMVAAAVPWRGNIASLNCLMASQVWRQDHNGFSHQEPGFVAHVVIKKADPVRVCLPPGANCLLSVMEHCQHSQLCVNVVIVGKHPAPQTLAAVSTVREHLPEIRIRVVNLVGLMRLQPETEHPHGLQDRNFHKTFNRNKSVIFSFYSCLWVIHRLAYRRFDHHNVDACGDKEDGTLTPPFDMAVLKKLDRFHLVTNVIDRPLQTDDKGLALKRRLKEKRMEPRQYSRLLGQDTPEICKCAGHPRPETT